MKATRMVNEDHSIADHRQDRVEAKAHESVQIPGRETIAQSEKPTTEGKKTRIMWGLKILFINKQATGFRKSAQNPQAG